VWRLVRAGQPADDISVEINIYRNSKNNKPRVKKFWHALPQQKASLQA